MTPTLPSYPLRFRTVGTELQFKPFPSYHVWLLACDLSDAIAAALTTAVNLYELPFTFADGTLILLTVPALATITSVRLHIEIAFDVATTITLGDDGDASRLLSSDGNNPQEAGIYQTSPDYEYSGATTLKLFILAPGATTGAGRIVLEYDKE